MTDLFILAPLLSGASCLYLFAVIWCFRASKRRAFSTSWLLLPLGGALLVGLTLVLSVPASPASPVSLRLLELLAHLCSILLIWKIAGKIAPAHRLAGSLLYAWNPLVLIELVVYANTAGIVTCLLLLALALLLVNDLSSSFAGMIPTFRRGGGWVDDGRGRLRRPSPAAGINPLPIDDTIRGHSKGAGGASTPTESEHGILQADVLFRQEEAGGASTPTESEEAILSATAAGGASAPSPLNPTPPPTGKRAVFDQIAELVLVGLAMRVNFMVLLLAPLLLWFMVRHRRSMGAALAGFAWRALVVLAIFGLAYLPNWRGGETFLAITNGLSLFNFANSPLSLIVAPARELFKFVADRAHFPALMQPAIAADMTVLATSFFLFALLYLREMGRVRARIHFHLQSEEETERVIAGEARKDEDGDRGDEDRHKAPTLPHINPLSLQETGPQVALELPDAGVKVHQDAGPQAALELPDAGVKVHQDAGPQAALVLSDAGVKVHQDGGDDVNKSFHYETLFTSWVVVVLGYIVLAATVFLPGYIVWGVWVVALRRFDALSVSVVLLSCSALVYYLFQWLALTAGSFVLPLCIYGIPLVYLVVQYCLPAFRMGRMERKHVLK